VHMENETSDVQPTCQGPLQLLSPPFLMTSNAKQMRPNGRGHDPSAVTAKHTGTQSQQGQQGHTTPDSVSDRV